MRVDSRVNVHAGPDALGAHQATMLYGGGLANAHCSCGWESALIAGSWSDAIPCASLEWAGHLAAIQ